MARTLYSAPVNKTNPPNTLESLRPCSGDYSIKKDMKLNRWLAVATAVYLVGFFLTRRHPDWSAPLRATLALSPLVPGLLYIRDCMRFVSGLDELERRIQLEAWLFAAVGTVLAGISISTLNASGIHLGYVDHGLGIGGAFMVNFVLWLVGSAIASCRFK
jgi:hypothetical protein